MEGALITVIVPAYNVERYLPRCLDSIVAQTYRNLDIIVVDDGSTDSTPAIADGYAAGDERIRVIHQPNGGLSAARNAALNVMHGSWVTMVDGDDVIAPTFVETLLHLAQEHEADIAVAEWLKPRADEPLPMVDAYTPRVTVFTPSEAIDDVFYQRTLTNSACSRLMAARLWRDLRFPVGYLYEDLAVVFDLLSRSSRIVYTSQPLYCYVQHAGSIIDTFTPQRAQVLDIMARIETQVAAGAPHHLPAVRSRYVSACFNILLLCSGHGEEFADSMDRCWREIKRLRRSVLLDRHARPRNRAALLASYLGRRVFIALFGGPRRAATMQKQR